MLPKGFKYAGINAGLKAKNKKDMGLIVSEVPAVCAGVLTKNQTAAACVKYNKLVLKKGKAKTIVVNTKNANAATGEEGERNNQAMAEIAETFYGGPVLTASTGIIGKQLPMDKISLGVEKLGKALKANYNDFANAILTTDLRAKKITKQIDFNGKKVVIAGAAKGSGMIHPNMATMLGFITTDAKIDKKTLKKMLVNATEASFNAITVDGDTSTNDMALVLANGLSGVKISGKKKKDLFYKTLLEVCIYLAKEIARDGEGATKLMEVTVSGARSVKDALQVAKTVAGSPLIKCAVYGGDNNWGRLIAAVGRAGVKIDPEKVTVNWQGLKTKNVKININLGKTRGKTHSATAWGCDLTEKYVEINTAYN